jgi:outer membrane receptor for ferrienterochelin and colicin
MEANFIGRSVFDTDPNGAYFGAYIPARWFFNTQVRWDVTDRAGLYAGVDNVFDEYVRVGGTNGDTSGPIASQTTGWTTYPDVYDGLGRRFYAGFRLRF